RSAGHEHDAILEPGALSSNCIVNVHSRDSRHHEIAEHDVELPPENKLDRAAPASGRRDILLSRQLLLEGPHERWLAVNEQDTSPPARHWGRWLFVRRGRERFAGAGGREATTGYGPFAGLALQLDLAAQRGRDAVADG